MKRTAVLLGLTFLGVAVGVSGTGVLTAQPPIKRIELMRTDLEGIEGKEGVVAVAEFAPGAAAGKHYHPGHEFFYILEGSIILETEGQPPVTFGGGQVGHNLPKRVHVVKNANSTEPAKAITFLIAGKGEPLSIPVK